ncbi:MAG: hypothetical protein ACKN9U_25010, partial [Pirellulaceae bacterium]
GMHRGEDQPRAPVTTPRGRSQGGPFKSIASLELFGTILCVVALGSASPRNSNGRRPCYDPKKR